MSSGGMDMKRDLLLVLPQIVLLLTAVGALVAEMLRRRRLGLAWTLGGLGAAGAAALRQLGADTTAFSGTFRVDALSHWSVLILAPAAGLCCLLARQELRGTPREGTVYSLLCFGTLGAALLAGTGDLMFLVLGLLINSLSGFALAAYSKTKAGTEGALKYFIYGTVTTAILIFGLTYWVGITGDTLLTSLARPDLPPLALAFGFVALITGLGYAASIFPFHFWTPDTFEGAPVSVAAYLSVVPKIGVFFALAQVGRSLPANGPVAWPLVLAGLAVASMTFGNLLALLQQNVVRLLAYSTIAQAGYFLLGVVGLPAGAGARRALIVFAAAYAAMNLGAFAVVLSTGKTLADFRGLGTRRVFAGAALTVFLFSLVGIPPLAGFAGKLLLFEATMAAGYTWLAVAAVLNSVLSLAVYLRVVAAMYFGGTGETSDMGPVSWAGQAVVVTCFLVTVLLMFVF
ncbi:NADH-quinone oxidoreductase subunit N [Hymenobacter sp. UV11]|uniref:NADH-quinone oxidoreductase subunit N n=1 Tax=Hymenobacter sp. UV11 TaxID=1849735 RepID=UPI001F0FB145|nr:NADH-quinone oxidoreductase subunit N [Hymenobacter sp. UV11]